ncbi:hypothetical protein GQ457_13G006380 [Hibiscus cannabinus]
MEKMTVTGKHSDEINKFLDGTASFPEMMFEFLDENLSNFVYRNKNGNNNNNTNIDLVEVEKNKNFWETQERLLQTTLYDITSLETRIQEATKEALREIDLIGVQCGCWRPVTGGCRNCLQREVSVHLQKKGFNCNLCKSKWKSSAKIPAGEHTYLEVLAAKTAGEKGVVIELNFQAEFEMGKANENYNRLVRRLPDLFVGKAERLKALIKILCSAAKKCMKEKKMHLAPWRRQKYMQAKWLGTYVRTTAAAVAPLPVGFPGRPQIPKVSMLTFDLRENSPRLHYAAVEVAC